MDDNTPTQNTATAGGRNLEPSPASIQTDVYKPERRNLGYHGWKFIVLLSVSIFAVVTIVMGYLYTTNFNYSVESATVSPINAADLINKKGVPTLVKTITIRNKFIFARKYNVPYLTACLKDNKGVKQNINLQTKLDSDYRNISAGQEIQVEPYTNYEIKYYVQGDWYDYVYQYLDYDSIKLVSSNTAANSNDCDNVSDPNKAEESISMVNNSCFGCSTTKGGVDLGVVDFIANDDKISENSFIHFIPIIKNLGDTSSGQIQVAYYLNNKHISSFNLNNVGPGEIINNFIAGSGFEGNIGATEDTDMQLKVVLTTLDTNDLNPENNEYVWNFHYTTTALPKHTCTYTDNNQGPDDFYKATSIIYNGKPYTDLCIDDHYLLEYLCDLHPAYNGDAGIDVFLYKCPDGCSQGSCKKTSSSPMIP